MGPLEEKGRDGIKKYAIDVFFNNAIIEFIPRKDAENRSKHGIGLALAGAMFADVAVVCERRDERRNYGEARIVAYGRIENRTVVCVYTWRGENCRIISLRKANSREQRLYFKAG